MACWDNPCFTLDIQAGETYYFMVTSRYGMGGDLVCSVDVAPPQVTIITPQANVAVQDGVTFQAKATDISGIYK